jgi:hypothetical protein
MRIKFNNEEYQISGIQPKGNTVVGGKYIAHEGVLVDGVEDITVWETLTDEDGNEYQSEVIPKPVSSDNTKAEIQAYLDEQGIEYQSSMTKAELLELIASLEDK